jgi:hypothetical protein
MSEQLAGHRVHDVALPAGVGGVDVAGQFFEYLVEVADSS